MLLFRECDSILYKEVPVRRQHEQFERLINLRNNSLLKVREAEDTERVYTHSELRISGAAFRQINVKVLRIARIIPVNPVNMLNGNKWYYDIIREATR